MTPRLSRGTLPHGRSHPQARRRRWRPPKALAGDRTGSVRPLVAPVAVERSGLSRVMDLMFLMSDPRNGGIADAVLQALAGPGARVIGIVDTPGGGIHVAKIPSIHPDRLAGTDCPRESASREGSNMAFAPPSVRPRLPRQEEVHKWRTRPNLAGDPVFTRAGDMAFLISVEWSRIVDRQRIRARHQPSASGRSQAVEDAVEARPGEHDLAEPVVFRGCSSCAGSLVPLMRLLLPLG